VIWRFIFAVVILLAPLSAAPNHALAQDATVDERSRIISVAKELIAEVSFVTLITLDETGHPQARTMEPFPPEEDLIVWMGTNKNSAKVGRIGADARATLHYQLADGNGYVSMTGRAELVDDESNKSKYWMPHWDEYYPDREGTYTLIKFTPERLEIVSYRHALIGDAVTWEAPGFDFH